MNPKPAKLIIAKDSNVLSSRTPEEETIAFESLRREIREGRIFRRLLRYREAELRTASIEYLPKPFFACLLVRIMARRRAYVSDFKGGMYTVTTKVIAQRGLAALRDAFTGRTMLRRIARDVAELATDPGSAARRLGGSDRRPIYLRTDLSYGIVSGGSVGHIGGVLNNLGSFYGNPLFITSDDIPGVRSEVEQVRIRADSRYFDFRELSSLHFNYKLMERIGRGLPVKEPAFLYQRYSLNNFTGVWLARRARIPFILEFNGSEIWVGRNWGKALAHEALSARIEALNLQAADLVVVVSSPLRDTLIGQGVPGDKILVNPNGVDEAKYSPAVDGSAVRARLNLEGKLVVGFIGTFGPWHGAEVLAEAFGQARGRDPGLADRLRLLMIGDGQRMPQVQEAIARHGMADACRLTGLLPQKEGPAHLAACDILVSPHVPNADGTPFFGSPTKLFEYMAMGKGIVASDLDQIGEVLEHGRTAWMTQPGDAASLADGILALARDGGLRARLGEAARAEAVSKHTWREHTRKILARLEAIYAGRSAAVKA